MFHLIYRQRRRILFSGILIATGMMSMAIGMSEASILWQEFETWIVVTALGLTSLVVLLLTLLAIAAMIVLLPRWRLIWEQVGLLLVLHAGLLAAFPWLGDLGVLSAFLPFFIIVAVGSVLYGPALDRFRLWVDHCERRSFRSVRTPEELWDNLIPNGDRIGTHWDPLLYRMEPIADEDDAFEVEYQLGHSVYEHQTITFLEKDYPRHFRYHHQGEVDPKNRSLVEGTYDVRIDPDEAGGTRVTITHCNNALLPRIGIMRWFDDELGSRVDYIRAKEAGRRDWSMAGLVRREIIALS